MKKHSSSINHRRLASRGFTIVELLIATSVFAVILLIMTTGLLQFSRSYTKGITENNTQTTTRNILNTVAQGIQFSSSANGYVDITANGQSKGFCINNRRYSYVQGRQLIKGTPDPGALQSNHVLVVDDKPDCSGATEALDVTGVLNMVGLKELLSTNMRLSKLSITDISQAGSSVKAYKVDVRVVYGDDDLLCSPSVTDASGTPSCEAKNTMDSNDILNASDVQCKSQVGSQYCAVSAMSTVVEKRL